MVNPSIFEINARLLVRRFSNDGIIKLDEIPDIYWKTLSDKGINYIWLMGVWKTCKSTVKKYCLTEPLIAEYKYALRDWKEEDTIGSPYAIDDYVVSRELGGNEALANLRKKLNKYGMKLILDFIPNHFCADTSLLRTDPYVFLDTDEEHYNNDPYTYYKPESCPEMIFAHGRDPFFPAWEDTVQINHFNPKARKFMIKKIEEISGMCDGVRCDMAMLSLNNIFKNTWGGALKQMGYEKPEKEFWEEAITAIKKNNKDFLFIGEAYWDLEWSLQQLGFDYTYDKRLTDRLRSGNVSGVRDHLRASDDFQQKSVRFIENHDEERAYKAFGKDPSFAAAIIISTIKGMRFYHDGQFEGKKIKLPVQLGREPEEEVKICAVNFYNKLLSIVKEDVFKIGEWSLVDLNPVWPNDYSYKNILAWKWVLGEDRRLVVVNYSNSLAKARVMVNGRFDGDKINFFDLLKEQLYIRNKYEIYNEGLYVQLNPWDSHIFSY